MVFDRRNLVARHPRLTRRGSYRDVLDHYLEILLVKPGAMAGSTALAEGSFTAVHEAFWAAAQNAHGDAAGTRALIEVLLLHRRMPAEAVETGIAAAVKAGSTSPDVVAIEVRKAEAAARDPEPEGDEDDPPHWADLPGGQIVSLTARRIALPEDRRPPPSVDRYDQLLTHRPTGSA
ncbi:hypothetical protein ACFYW6_38520 [Streptomyces sp. NPDC002659]|uniref:hypothetical protein n=1 Tax=Streptomyces sp. NPDC002659 TaxID=3364656 RepID=UPI0036A77657